MSIPGYCTHAAQAQDLISEDTSRLQNTLFPNYSIFSALINHKLINKFFIITNIISCYLVLPPITIASNSVEKLFESFKNPTILLIDGKLTYATVHSLYELLISNTPSYYTNLGCVNLDHLCLTLSLTIYETLSATPVVPPHNPGAVLLIPAGDTG